MGMAVLAEMGFSEDEALSRYDLILDVVRDSQIVRTDSEIDRTLSNAWVRHHHVHQIESTSPCVEMVKRARDVILQLNPKSQRSEASCGVVSRRDTMGAFDEPLTFEELPNS